jgi:hypothetical protein
VKVKTFTGTHRATVDKQVNDWLAETNVTVRKTSTAFKQLRERGWDAITGRTTARRALGIAISVWYDEPASKSTQSRPTTWIFANPQHPLGPRKH